MLPKLLEHQISDKKIKLKNHVDQQPVTRKQENFRNKHETRTFKIQMFVMISINRNFYLFGCGNFTQRQMNVERFVERFRFVEHEC